MSRLLRRPERATNSCRTRVFDFAHEPGSGFSFPCDEAGNLAAEEGSTLSRVDLLNRIVPSHGI